MTQNVLAAAPARVVMRPPSSRRRAEQAAEVSEGHEPVVFVVDPDASTRSLLMLGLTRQGFSVSSHENAESALAALEEGGRLPAVILSETALASTDGYRFCARVRASMEMAAVPFVLLARDAEPAHHALAVSSGADQLLPKPLHLSDVVALTQLLAGERLSDNTFTFDGERLPIVPLLRALLAGNRSGRLDLSGGGTSGGGHLVFHEGFVVDAAMDDGHGVSALTRLLLCGNGTWTVTFGPSLVSASFSMGLEALCASVFPVVERWNALLPRCVPLDAVLVLNPAAQAMALERLPESVSGLLRLFDGKRTVRECVLNAPLDEVTALKVTTRLYLMGIVATEVGEPVAAPLLSLVQPTPLERKGSVSSKVSQMRNRRRPTAPLLALPMIPSVSAEQLAQAGQAVPIEPSMEAGAESLEPFVPTTGFELPADPFADLTPRSPVVNGREEHGTAAQDAWAALDLDPSLARHMAAFNIQQVQDAGPSEAVLPESTIEEVGPEDFVLEEADSLNRTPRISSDVARAFENAERESTDVAVRPDALTPTVAFDELSYDEFLTELESSPRADIRDEAREAREAAPMLLRDLDNGISGNSASGLPPDLDLSFLRPLTDEAAIAPARPVRRKQFQLPWIVTFGIGGGLIAGAVMFAMSLAPEYHPYGAEPEEPSTPLEMDAWARKSGAAEAPASPLRTLPAQPPVSTVTERAAPVPAVAKAEVPVKTEPAGAVAPAAVSKAPTATPASVVSPAPAPVRPASARVSAPPASGEISLERGMKLYDQGKMREAARVLTRVVENMPSSSQAWLMLGLARFDAGDADAALSAARKALELDPQNGRGIMLLATIHLDAGDQAHGREALERYLKLEPKGKFAEEARLILRQLR